jgi:hypothetical protein
VGLTNLGSESKTCVGSRVHLVGVSISIEKNFYQLPVTPPLSGSPYRSFKKAHRDNKRSSGVAPGSGTNKKFRFVKKNVPNPSQQSSTGR